MKPIANSIGVSKVIDPFHIVASQLNTFTPVGTAMSIVAYMGRKLSRRRHTDGEHVMRPTMNERIAIDEVA
jgi:hypothetical protein